MPDDRRVKSLITNRKSQIKSHWAAALILLAFILLAVGYSFATPPFEAGDESRHYAVVKYMADTGQLINQNDPAIAALQHHWSHEGSQPPLYYALAAALTAPIPTGGWDEVFWYNPHTTIGNPLRPDNKNITIHPPGESPTQGGAVLAVHLIRLLSIAMAAGTVLTSYLIVLRLFNGDRRLAAGAMSITAFNPMFIFIAAAVNNDNAVILFCTLTLYLLTTPNAQIRRPLGYAALLGLLIGLGALSKLYAFGLLPLAALRLIYLRFSIDDLRLEQNSRITPKFWRDALLWNLALILVFTAVAGWFYARNAALYHGDVFALQVMRETAGTREEVPSLATLRAEFEGFRIAYWALFGGVNILAAPWIYTLLDAVSLAAFIGLLAYVLRVAYLFISHHSQRRSFTIHHSPFTIYNSLTLAILLGWTLIMVAGFIAWNITQPAGQGRLMYPAIAAISALAMLGLTWWLPRRWQGVVAAVCALGLFLFAAIAPFRTIAPAYAAPPLLTEADLPADLIPVNFSYDDGALRLLGYQLHADAVRPAETLPITLYWQLLRPTDTDYSIFIHLLGRGRQVIGQVDSYPGGGKWPTTLLPPGDIVGGYYEVPVSPQAEFDHAPARLQIAAGIYNLNEPGLPGKAAVDAAGAPVDPVIGAVKLTPWQWPQPPTAGSPVNFFDRATLLGHQLAPDNSSVTLVWQADAPLDADFTVFIQAWDEAGQYAAGFDGPPVGGDYPTSWWAPGEIIEDTHPLDLSQLPPGRYTLLAGLYNPATGERLPAFGPDGPLPDYAVNLGEINVSGQ
ncbi:MAG: hypothetical protein Kow0031_00380 [Anaerolineae bacterium]